jgi:NADH dehydrogenase
VIGGGPTGVELAGAIAELARDTLRKDFRVIHPQDATITLLEGGERILPTFPEDLARKARMALEKHGITVLTGTKVVQLSKDAIGISRQNLVETLRARTILWAAGVTASPLGRVLAERTGARMDRQGRIVCEPDLTLPGHGEVFVLGDLAHCADAEEKPLPGLAPVAMQEAWYAARVIKHRLEGRTALPSFRYRNRGNLSTVGRSFAVAHLGRFHFSGFFAWILWVFVHILYLVGFENRVLVLTQWAWNYFTRNRSARLITWMDRGGPAA